MAAPIHTNPTLRIDPRTDGVLSLAGELDLASAPQLRAAVQQQLDAGAQRLLLDLADLSFCDSAGLTVLVWADQAFPDGVLLRHPSPQLRKVLHATRLEQSLTID